MRSMTPAGRSPGRLNFSVPVFQCVSISVRQLRRIETDILNN